MMILRPKLAQQRLGIGKSAFFANFVYRPGGPEFVEGTRAVPRLRPVPITGRIDGFVDVEIDEVIQGIRDERDAGLLVNSKARDQGGRFVGKRQQGDEAVA
jgi:hypothetical protein